MMTFRIHKRVCDKQGASDVAMANSHDGGEFRSEGFGGGYGGGGGGGKKVKIIKKNIDKRLTTDRQQKKTLRFDQRGRRKPRTSL